MFRPDDNNNIGLCQTTIGTSKSHDLVALSQLGPADTVEDVNRCYNFSVGMTHKQEFYSPGYPANYPAKVDCFLVLSGKLNWYFIV